MTSGKIEEFLSRWNLGDTGPVPSNPRLPIFVGLLVVGLGIGGFGGWAAIAEISSAVIAPGTVKVSTNRKKVQPLERGVVRELLVGNGDRVEAGDVLIRLDTTRSGATRAIIANKHDAVRAEIARLQAEQVRAETITFPADLVAHESNPDTAEILDSQRRLFETRRTSRAGQLDMIGERIGQLEEEIRGLEAQVDAKGQQIEFITEELLGLNELHKKGYAPKTRILALEREAAALVGERGEHKAEIARARRLISEARLEMLQLEKTFDEEVATELRRRKEEASDLGQRLAAASYMHEQMEIRATESGYVVGLDVHTVGGVVEPGATLMEIVPEEDLLVVEARIRPVDIDDIHVGLKADVRLTAFSQRTTLTLEGDVTYVSADSLTDKKSETEYFVARIEVGETELARLGDRQLVPGMPAETLIKTGSRTPIAYLTQPLTDSLSKAWREP